MRNPIHTDNGPSHLCAHTLLYLLTVDGVKKLLGEETVAKMLKTVSGEVSSAEPYRFWMPQEEKH